MNRKKLWFLVLSVIILVSFISGCIGGGQFGAPSADSTVTIKGVVVAPDNDCFTDACSNPSIIEGEPLPNADIILKGNNGQTLTGKTDCAGNYQISGLTDEGYILYANRGEVWIKKALSPVTGDGGEANYITTAQVILWEVIENTNPGAIAINDIPTAISFDAIPQEFIDAVKAALADCRDAQQDPTCLALAKNIAVANFGAPCGCIEVTPTPTPNCPVGVAVAKISISDLGGLSRRFDASGSIPQTGQYKIKSYAWKISDEKEIIYESSQKIFDYSFPGLGNYSVSLTVTTPCEDASTSQNFQILPAKLTIKKVLAPNSDPGGPWAFNLTGPGTNQNFNLAADGQEVFNSLTPGQYTITENPGTFQCVSITVNGNPDPTPGDGSVTFDLTSGAEITVVYTNNKTSQPAKLTIKKVLAPNSDPGGPWAFNLTGPGTNQNFNLAADGQEVFNSLTPGQYTITENPGTFQCVSITVNGNPDPTPGDGSVTFDLTSGAEITVVYTNNKTSQPAKLTIKKVLAPNSDPGGPWAFNLTGPGTNQNFNLAADGQEVFNSLTPGQYTITENPNGYACSTEFTGFGVESIIKDGCSVTFTLLSEADVTVIFSNQNTAQNIQDILIVNTPVLNSISEGFIKIVSDLNTPGPHSSYIRVQYRQDGNSYGPVYDAWCIEHLGNINVGNEYRVRFYPANQTNQSIGSDISKVWGVINFGIQDIMNTQYEIWHITDNNPDYYDNNSIINGHNSMFDSINPNSTGTGIVCYPIQ